MLPIYFAPLQGYTECAYRQAHFLYAGTENGQSGITTYYTPFLRVEKGVAREKDLRDLKDEAIFIDKLKNENPELAQKYIVVPQVICKDINEFSTLVEAIRHVNPAGSFPQIDINMGCPFPMQSKSGRGSGILPHTETVRDILAEVKKMPEKFSIKMRLGYTSPDECMALLPILNDAPLSHITMHPRLGIQQYKGALDFEAFDKFYKECGHPLIFNGDITCAAQIKEIENKFPNIQGIMIGRGLLTRPTLAAEYKNQNSSSNPIKTLQDIHDYILKKYRCSLQGEAQILEKIRTFWTYPDIPKRDSKRISKARNLNEYLQVVSSITF